MSNSPDVHALTGAYAADALDGEEREVFVSHLRQCEACQKEVAELTATAARLALAASAPAPPELRARVLAEVAHTRQLSPSPQVARLSDRRRWYQQPASVAAALLLVVSGGLGALAVSEQQQARDADQRAARVTALAVDPTHVVKTGEIASGGTATVIAARGSALFHTSGLDQLPDGKVYQLWLLRADGAQSVGVLGNGGELEALVEHMTAEDGLGLTIEPAGGSKMPTDGLVVRLDVA